MFLPLGVKHVKTIRGKPLFFMLSSLKVFNVWLSYATSVVTGAEREKEYYDGCSHCLLALHRSPTVTPTFTTHMVAARINQLLNVWEI